MLYDFQVKRLNGTPVTLSDYRGKVLLIVNTASECGLTPQYKGLQELHEAYQAQGLQVLGFPSNDFGAQEPGTNEQIGQFCAANYGVGFDMFAKIPVKGESQAPLYQYLTSQPGAEGEIRWNFDKFLVDRSGKVIKRFHPKTEPTDPEIVTAIQEALKA
ncbi:glutathione peroxidase [bacterium]|nr:glutathione peroxidase [bacterium]